MLNLKYVIKLKQILDSTSEISNSSNKVILVTQPLPATNFLPMVPLPVYLMLLSRTVIIVIVIKEIMMVHLNVLNVTHLQRLHIYSPWQLLLTKDVFK